MADRKQETSGLSDPEWPSLSSLSNEKASVGRYGDRDIKRYNNLIIAIEELATIRNRTDLNHSDNEDNGAGGDSCYLNWK